MARLSKEQLNELMQKENVSRIWSYSRINCFLTSKYEYFLSYVKHEKADREDCIYGSLGGAAHQCLEDYYTGKILYEDMAEQFEDSWITCRDVAQLKFDRNDEEKDLKIANKYHDDLNHFLRIIFGLMANPQWRSLLKLELGTICSKDTLTASIRTIMVSIILSTGKLVVNTKQSIRRTFCAVNTICYRTYANGDSNG